MVVFVSWKKKSCPAIVIYSHTKHKQRERERGEGGREGGRERDELM